jgi:hypothetical protein
MRFVGDIHGGEWFKKYLTLTQDVSDSIQLGDFGIGFGEPLFNEGNHRFIRGNHDDPQRCKMYHQYIPDGSFENGMFFLGGGHSANVHQRTEGVDWWRDEELSTLQGIIVLDKWEEYKPDIMVTHDTPQVIAEKMDDFLKYPLDGVTRTRQLLNAMLDVHKPKLWIYAHYHVNYTCKYEGVEFFGVNKLEYIDIDI